MSEVSQLITLIDQFLTNQISVSEFERSYIDQYTDGKEPLEENVFQILDWLFFQVDSYTDLPMEPGDNPDNYINEEQLRENAAITLRKLREN